VVVPGHPDLGPFYLIKGLLNAVKDYPWEKGGGTRMRVYMNMMVLFSILAQHKLPYHVGDSVKGASALDSNDVLYAREESYLTELQALLDKLLDEILTELAASKQPTLALELLNSLVFSAQLTPASAALAYDLFSLAHKGCQTKEEKAFLRNTLQSISRCAATKGRLYQELSRRLHGVS